jgi:DNA-binding MarR family transcriptional regulator
MARNNDTRAPQDRLKLGLLPTLLGYNVRRAQMSLWRDFNRTVGTGVVRPGIFSMMVLISSNPGIAQIELATQLAIDKASMVGLIRQIQRQGWIDRRPSTVDRRRQGVTLTPRGRQALLRLRKNILDHEVRFKDLFTREELQLFLEFLRRMQI